MKIEECLALAAQHQVELWFEGDRLRYRAPKGGLPLELKTLFTENKESLLQALRQRASQSVSEVPLSYGQQSLWFLNQSDPASASYHVAFTGRICSEVNVPALESALQALVDRHATLRTTFHAVGGVPVQRVVGYAPAHFEQVDAAPWSDADLDAHIRQAYLTPFDLEKGPLLRTYLFTRAERAHVLLINIHHIVVDAWSLWILLDELRALVAANTRGSPAQLQRPAVDYADFVRWQQEMLSAPSGGELEAFWLERMAGELPVLAIPTDRPRPPVQTDHGRTEVFVLNEALSSGLRALAKAEGVTLYMLLFAAFQVLLCRYTGQTDLVTGVPTFGRSRPEFSRIVGDFINMIPLRVDCAGNPAFKTLLSRVRQTVLAALDHQDYPFPRLVAKLGGHRDASRSPIFQVTFDVQRLHSFGELAALFMPDSGASVDFGGLTLQAYVMPQQEGQFDLGLLLMDMMNELPGILKYNSDLYEAATVRRILDSFQTLLEGIVAHPEQPIAELPVLSPDERQRLLVEWNQTQADYPREICLHQLFEAQVERSPDAVAVSYEDQVLTYAQLNARANQLAHFLRAQGVKPDTLVGICMERSLEMVVALYGVLKAGGAYVPIDPAYPPERLALMIEDTQTPVLLIQEHLRASLPETAAQVVALDAEGEVIARESAANLASPVGPHNLAYIIYTSGSTGRPKGAMIQHEAIVNHLCWYLEIFPLTRQDVVLQKTPFSFDASVHEFHAPLLSGAKLVMAQPGGHQDGYYLTQVIIEQQVTTLQVVPSQLQLLLETPGFEQCVSLKRVLCGGEPLSMSLVHQVASRLKAEVYNLYGPTEAAIDTVYWRCDSNYPQSMAPIGRPVTNTQAYILDENLQPVPVGASGELYLGGTQVGLGYYRRPDMTKAKFIADPFSSNSQARLYKTGDLVRYLPNGLIEYLGRKDFQVKLRGFRIELGEIEAVLGQHPAVEQAVVIVREDSAGDKRLVAYLTVKPGPAPSGSSLRKFLRDQLPSYMVPAAYVVLEAFPLMPNGKIDRRALPVPAQGAAESLKTGQPPVSPMEKLVAEAWTKVLKVPQVSLYDNFFDLGGHSLSAIQVVSYLHEKTGHRLNPAYLRFETLGQVAVTLEEQISGKHDGA